MTCVLGVVSGGRGTLGECGGINNPIHYTRVKKFSRWIVENVDDRDRAKICWNSEFQSRLKRPKKTGRWFQRRKKVSKKEEGFKEAIRKETTLITL